ncbi:MAG: hypothetical protein WBD27_02220 [Pyrinomonadaceae bacterium]
MEQATQMEETKNGQIVGEFYYSLALLQTKAMNYVARGENVDDKIKRVKTLTEQIQEVIKLVEETGAVSEVCDMGSHWDETLQMCVPNFNRL